MLKRSLLNAQLFKNKAFINGEWIHHSKTYTVCNPAQYSEPLAQVPDMNADDAKIAIRAAKDAQDAWRKYSGRKRSDLLRNWYNLVMKHQNDLATLVTLESGKPFSESLKEVAYGASFIQWFSEEAVRIYGDIIPFTSGKRILVTKQPVGPVGLITPWNFPIAMITRKASAALAAGCTVVCKPAPETPLSALALAELSCSAGIPSGVFNVITSSKDQSPSIGLELCANPAIRKISFTGSTLVGKWLAEKCASNLKRVSLELGGNAPFVVFEDADLSAAIEGFLTAKFRNTGQTCIAANRIYVHSSVYSTFSQMLIERMKQLHVGDGFEPNVSIGPLISQAGYEKAHRHVTQMMNMGAELVMGGKQHSKGGLFYEPTLLLNVDHSKAVIQAEESFAPIAGLIPFETEAQVMEWANDTRHGLGSYFYTRDVGRIFRISNFMESGMVGINDANISNEVAPFGGIKDSGMGREGSKYGIEEYLDIKYTCIGGIQE
jgi:succinate-semialdehyde dehydrogenase/glutarate-semialdehyde dehydrogenase